MQVKKYIKHKSNSEGRSLLNKLKHNRLVYTKDPLSKRQAAYVQPPAIKVSSQVGTRTYRRGEVIVSSYTIDCLIYLLCVTKRKMNKETNKIWRFYILLILFNPVPVNSKGIYFIEQISLYKSDWNYVHLTCPWLKCNFKRKYW